MVKKRKINIAICQMIIENNKTKNLKKAQQMIEKAVDVSKVDLVVLPEMFNCPYDNDFFPYYAEEFGEDTTKILSQIAKNRKIYLIGGSIPEISGGKIYNTSYMFNPSGEMIGYHRKIHLFDVEVENGIKFKESSILSAGDQITIIDTSFARIGIAICYDMRFPELIRLMTVKGANIIVIPAAFNTTTGPAHWDSLIKIRAVDNQVYIVAASPARNYKATYHVYGHSAIVDPWGSIISKADEGEQIIYGEIDLEYVDKVRNQLPLLKHRRIDLY